MKQKPKVEILSPLDGIQPLDTAIEEIERLVRVVAHAAVQQTTPLDQKTDALKACTPYYLALTKGKNREPDDTSPGFTDFASAIQNAESHNGSRAPVRGGGRTDA